MTLAEIAALDATYITAEQAAGVTGLSPHNIRMQAQEDQRKLGFPVCVAASRIKIPRVPFLEFWGWRREST